MSTLNSWFFSLFALPSRREKFTVVMPSGREMRVVIDDNRIEVDMGEAKQCGVEESFKMVGDELHRSFEQVREEDRVKER